jgi:predicted outer membrane repeat protein
MARRTPLSGHDFVAFAWVGLVCFGGFSGRAAAGGRSPLGSSFDGGAILVEAGALELTDVKVDSSSAASGGGLFLAAGTNATIQRSLFSSNSAVGDGGAIALAGSLVLENSTVVMNQTVFGSGAGLRVLPGGSAAVRNCTIAGNTTSSGVDAQGIFSAGTAELSNSILAYNQIGDCNQISDLGHNIVFALPCTGAGDSGRTMLGVDPLLDPPANNGGAMETAAPTPASPAIDQGDDATCLADDAIGSARPVGRRCDIGALEVQNTPTCGSGWPVALPPLGGENFWIMWSPPCETFLSSPSFLYGGDMGSAVYDADWVMWARDASVDAYVKLGESDATLPAGNGYWLGRTLEPLGGVLTTVGSSIDLDTLVAQVGAPVPGRWNLLGNPYESWIDWPNVQVDYSSSLHSLQQAQTDGVMDQRMWKYNGMGSYIVSDPAVPGAEGIVWRGEAFWTKAFDAQPSQVNLPAPPPAGGPAKPGSPERAKRRPILGPGEWTVRLTASAVGAVDPGNLFGRLDGTSKGWDSRDLWEPPLPAFVKKQLTVVFPHDDWGEKAGAYTTDFHPLAGLTGDSWNFEVRSTIHDRPITLGWSGPADVIACSRLVDLETGEVIVPEPTGHYRFTLAAASRSFRWEFGSPSPDELRRRPVGDDSR